MTGSEAADCKASDGKETVPAGSAAGGDGAWPSRTYAWYIVVVLTLAYTCSFIDRQVLTLLIEPIRRDLQINDTQIGLLGGLAFSIFYTLLGIPLARIADRASRRNLMTAGVAVWSLMTAACGLARGFWPLFTARVGVGVGEAALSPAAFSLLADYFPRQSLARAISVYSTGVYFGAGLALMIGGTIIRLVSNAPTQTLPVFGELYPWQLTFIVVGALGLPIVLLMFTIREPARRGLGDGDRRAASSWPALRGFLATNAWAVTCHIGAFTLYGIAIGNYLFWTPSMIMRTFGWDAPRAGLTLGAILFVFGTFGVYAGGWLADRLARSGRTDAILRAAFIGMCCGLPLIVSTPLVGDVRIALVLLSGAIFFLALPQGLPAAALQVMTPNPLRAQMTAIYFFIGNLIANGLGPMFAGLLTDYAFGDPAMLRYALAIVCATAAPLSVVLLYVGLPHYRASVLRAGNPGSGNPGP
ncbi:MAG: MFS transporter [Rhodobacteraceae bacterium]|nr:MFS transporter [Paracoccaceae bacterium]